MKPADPRIAPPLLLRGLAAIYGSLVALRNRSYDRPGRSHQAGLPVLSVGNLTVGGTGKTPMVAWIARRLVSDGRRPAVVSRGYGGTAGVGPLVVSTGEGPLCTAEASGDEPWLLARELPGTIVVVGSARRKGVDRARRLGADTVLLDDGFQHRSLARDLDIVLLDAEAPFGNGALLPAGRLREPVAALGRADVVVATRSTLQQPLDRIETTVRRYNRRAPILRAGHSPLGFFDPAGDAVSRPSRVVAFCGIGNPDSFRSDLLAEGCEVLRFTAFRDHHDYRTAELRSLHDDANSLKAALLTTDKDLVRLRRRAPRELLSNLLVLRIAVVVYDPGPLTDAIAGALTPGGRPAPHEGGERGQC